MVNLSKLQFPRLENGEPPLHRTVGENERDIITPSTQHRPWQGTRGPYLAATVICVFCEVLFLP